jgi:hypothetical protein
VERKPIYLTNILFELNYALEQNFTAGRFFCRRARNFVVIKGYCHRRTHFSDVLRSLHFVLSISAINLIKAGRKSARWKIMSTMRKQLSPGCKLLYFLPALWWPFYLPRGMVLMSSKMEKWRVSQTFTRLLFATANFYPRLALRGFELWKLFCCRDQTMLQLPWQACYLTFYKDKLTIKAYEA